MLHQLLHDSIIDESEISAVTEKPKPGSCLKSSYDHKITTSFHNFSILSSILLKHVLGALHGLQQLHIEGLVNYICKG